MTKIKSNIPLGMVDVLYSRRYQPQQNYSYFLTELKRFGKLSPQEMAIQMGITPREKESKLPAVLLGNLTSIS